MRVKKERKKRQRERIPREPGRWIINKKEKQRKEKQKRETLTSLGQKIE